MTDLIAHITEKARAAKTAAGLLAVLSTAVKNRALRAMADARQPYTLVDGVGRVWGRWRIDAVSEDQERVIDDGTATLLSWTLELQEFVNATG